MKVSKIRVCQHLADISAITLAHSPLCAHRIVSQRENCRKPWHVAYPVLCCTYSAPATCLLCPQYAYPAASVVFILINLWQKSCSIESFPKESVQLYSFATSFTSTELRKTFRVSSFWASFRCFSFPACLFYCCCLLLEAFELFRLQVISASLDFIMWTFFFAVNAMCCASLAHAFTAINDRNFHQAVNTFMTNKSDATSTYGGIEGTQVIFTYHC